MKKVKLILLLLVTTPLLSFIQPHNHRRYVPFILYRTAGTFRCEGQIMGVVYEDRDGDGQRDDNEPGVSGVRLMLHSPSMPEHRVLFTDQHGCHLLNTQPGRYELYAEAPAGYTWTTPNAWGIDVECARVNIYYGLMPNN